MSNVKIDQLNGGTLRAPIYANDPLFEYEEGGVSYQCKLSQLLVPQPITILKKTTGQSCTTGSWNTVTWDTATYEDDVGAFASGSPTIMTVPTGFSRVRMSGQSIWANSGSWTAYLQCGCSRAVGPGGATAVAVDIVTGNNEHGYHWITPWLTGLVAGDTFSVQVNQSSGATVNFSPASGFTQAWWQAEWAK
jgi:hypothetical protein